MDWNAWWTKRQERTAEPNAATGADTASAARARRDREIDANLMIMLEMNRPALTYLKAQASWPTLRAYAANGLWRQAKTLVAGEMIALTYSRRGR